MRQGILRYGEQSTSYQVIETLRVRKKVLIHVHPNGLVEVEAPAEISPEQINSAVHRRARWIMKQLESAANARAYALPREYVSGETHFYLGRRYQLKVCETREEPSSVKLLRGKIVVTLRNADSSAVKRRLRAWYKERSLDYLARRIENIVENISWIKEAPPFKLVSMQKQWGSCSPVGSINLSPDLIKAPRDCINYVITHELCHLREHNHSKRFYKLLEQSYPQWQVVKSKLDDMAELILAS